MQCKRKAGTVDALFHYVILGDNDVDHGFARCCKEHHIFWCIPCRQKIELPAFFEFSYNAYTKWCVQCLHIIFDNGKDGAHECTNIYKSQVDPINSCKEM